MEWLWIPCFVIGLVAVYWLAKRTKQTNRKEDESNLDWWWRQW